MQFHRYNYLDLLILLVMVTVRSRFPVNMRRWAHVSSFLGYVFHFKFKTYAPRYLMNINPQILSGSMAVVLVQRLYTTAYQNPYANKSGSYPELLTEGVTKWPSAGVW